MLLGPAIADGQFRVDYLRPEIDRARRNRHGAPQRGLVGVVDIDVTNEGGQLLAIGRAT
jgi:hypothetical protein